MKIKLLIMSLVYLVSVYMLASPSFIGIFSHGLPLAIAGALGMLAATGAYGGYMYTTAISTSSVPELPMKSETEYTNPFVAYNTLQMRTAAENGTFGCMMMEYQSYSQDAALTSSYKFIPFGIRHDNPLAAVGKLDPDETKALEMFADFCKSDKAMKLASDYGFNQMDEYNGDNMNISGNSWTQMQKLWKNNKNNGKPIAAVFVLDTSGSMTGAPLNSLKSSLRNSIKYINSSNYIGVVSYASNVNVDLEIGKFDLNQQAYFMGAVDSLTASGNTATFSALSQAMIMLRDFTKDNPNVSPMVFLLSDGKSNAGSSFSYISGAVSAAQIPIYTIGYNANLNELKSISELNEAATINADTDDVIYQLKNLFNANL